MHNVGKGPNNKQAATCLAISSVGHSIMANSNAASAATDGANRLYQHMHIIYVLV